MCCVTPDATADPHDSRSLCQQVSWKQNAPTEGNSCRFLPELGSPLLSESIPRPTKSSANTTNSSIYGLINNLKHHCLVRLSMLCTSNIRDSLITRLTNHGFLLCYKSTQFSWYELENKLILFIRYTSYEISLVRFLRACEFFVATVSSLIPSTVFFLLDSIKK